MIATLIVVSGPLGPIRRGRLNGDVGATPTDLQGAAVTEQREKIILIATLIVVSGLLGLVAALPVVVISCHLGGAGLVLATFRLPVSGLVTKARNVSDFLFWILVTMSSRFALFKFQNLLFFLAS